MVYRKINVELVVFADEADSVVSELNSAIDRLEETHTIFGGGIEMATVKKSGTRRKSALTQTLAAGGAALAAVKLAGDKVRVLTRKSSNVRLVATVQLKGMKGPTGWQAEIVRSL